jgi:hypothetical protein
MLDFAHRLTDSIKYREPNLSRFKSVQVSLVRDQAVCDRAGRAYGQGKGPARRVVVIKLGNAGYVVFDPFEPERAGEFETWMVFDRRWRLLHAWVG